ncbi:hypothetical protein NSMS1_67230 (plasmid) [Nostoc sp. MS1]|nr:hypothetical protein NSMS1_67230 [Nostoc sp. MS1]
MGGDENTAGFGDTFKSGATFIGCEATSKKLSPLKSISLATGRYFLADPDSFDRAIAQGEIGTIPEWLKLKLIPILFSQIRRGRCLNIFQS